MGYTWRHQLASTKKGGKVSPLYHHSETIVKSELRTLKKALKDKRIWEGSNKDDVKPGSTDWHYKINMKSRLVFEVIPLARAGVTFMGMRLLTAEGSSTQQKTCNYLMMELEPRCHPSGESVNVRGYLGFPACATPDLDEVSPRKVGEQVQERGEVVLGHLRSQTTWLGLSLQASRIYESEREAGWHSAKLPGRVERGRRDLVTWQGLESTWDHRGSCRKQSLFGKQMRASVG